MHRGIKSVCVYGGGDRKKQIKVVTEGVQIIIATPGRLNDLVEAGCIKVESITYLVLDEADRMLDMGFEPQVLRIQLIVSLVRHDDIIRNKKNRQSFSRATLFQPFGMILSGLGTPDMVVRSAFVPGALSDVF